MKVRANRTLLELTAILENASVAIVFTQKRMIQRCNRRTAEIFGYRTSEELSGRPAITLYPDAESYERLGREAGPLLAGGGFFHGDWLMRRADGSPVWCNLYGKAVDPDNTDEGSVWIIEDVTDARRAAEALRRTAREMEAIMKNAPIGIFFTRERHLVRYNAKVAEIAGFEGDEGVGMPTRAFFRSDEEFELLGREVAPLLSKGIPFQKELFLRRRDGTDVWVNLVAYVQNAEDTHEGTIWLLEDRTAMLQAEQALRRASAEQRRLLDEMAGIMDNASIGIVITRDRRMIRYNARFAEMYGFAGDEAIGLPGRTIYRSDAEYDALGALARPLLSQGRPVQAELFMRRRDGADLWVNLRGYVQQPDNPLEGTVWLLEDRTAVKHAEDTLARVHAEHRLILDHSVVGIAFVRNGIIRRCNRRMHEIYDYAVGELEGRSTRTLFPAEDAYDRVNGVACRALARGETFAEESVQRRRDGEPFWVRISGRALDVADPEAGSIWNFEDVTSRKVAEESLRESETLQRAILQSASLAILATDKTGRIASCNPAGERMLGMTSEAVLGRLPTELFFVPEELEAYRRRSLDDAGMEPADAMAALCAQPRLGRVEEGEWTFRRADGVCFPVQLSIAPLREGTAHVSGFLFVAADITERKRAEDVLRRSRDELEVRVRERTAKLEAEVVQRRRAEERLKYLAQHDALTGLANRNLLRSRMARIVEQVSAAGQLGAVLFIDLDRFKNVNDTLGHRVGDGLLKEVARRISGAVRNGDVVARLGGDEFVVVAGVVERRQHAERIAEKILGSLQHPIRVQQHELFATPSIGIALFPHDDLVPDALIQKADAAMYQAKSAGRNTYRFFDPAMAANAERYLRTESSLRKALERHEFEPHYQPIVSLATGRVEALELLVRWRHPQLGLVPPADFIPIAEDSGLVGRVGMAVLEAACRQYAAWRAAGLEVPRFALNLSALQFRDPRLIDAIAARLSQYAIEPSCFELEITETALMQDGEQTLQILQSLAAAGFALSVDDFGTGYSSLAYLKSFPVGKLKIDKSFIQDMTRDPHDEAIVRMIIALAQTLRIATVAEGVETTHQREALERLGCDFAQGFLFAAPLPAGEIEAAALQRVPTPRNPASEKSAVRRAMRS